MKKKITCQCDCHDHPILILDSKQSALTSIVIIALGLILFISGYLIGKKNAFDAFARDMSEQSFADRLHHSMTMLYGADHKAPQALPENETALPVPVAANVPSQATATPHAQEIKVEKHYAQLDRFSTRSLAQQLVDRLQKRGITTTLIKRTSETQTRDGKKQVAIWYTVHTACYPTRTEVEALVSSIKITENLKQVTYLKR